MAAGAAPAVQGYSSAGGSAAACAAGSPVSAGGTSTADGSGGTNGTGSGPGGAGSAGSSGSAGGGSVPGAVGANTGGGGSTGPASNPNDTTHCAGNREFSSAIDYYAPPCTPGPVGPSNYPNGGATYQGATGNTITIVDYVTDYGAEINTILKAEQLYESYQQGQQLDQAWQTFI